MNRLTVSQCRATISRVLGTCTTDSRVVQYLNEAQERLLPKGKWLGSVIRYRFCTSQSCITMPRQIETIEAWALCDQPMTVRDKWYEFIANGPGQRRGDLGTASQLIDRGTACCYQDISGPNSKINVVSTQTEATDARILLQGYDTNAQWIRTQDSGTWIDGEYVTLFGAGARTTNSFSSLTGVIKPITNGNVGLYEWPVSLGGNLQQLAQYEPDETTPIYRRYLIPNLDQTTQCCNSQDSCDDRTITILAKLRHMPVSVDNDFLILGNIAALKLEVMAILKEEKNLWQEAVAYETKAISELESELSSFEGDGPTPVLRLADTSVFGGGVDNEIDGYWIRAPFVR